MYKMPIVSLAGEVDMLDETRRHVSVLWQQPESLVFVARGREYRSEFHINPTDELMYQIKGEMKLHYRTPEGKEEIAILPEGSVIHTPAGIPHSPRFPPDAYAMIVERKRKEGEVDRFQWFCPECDNFLHEEEFIVSDYAVDPVGKAYKRFYDTEAHRTCNKCGHIMPNALAESTDQAKTQPTKQNE